MHIFTFMHIFTKWIWMGNVIELHRCARSSITHPFHSDTLRSVYGSQQKIYAILDVSNLAVTYENPILAAIGNSIRT